MVLRHCCLWVTLGPHIVQAKNYWKSFHTSQGLSTVARVPNRWLRHSGFPVIMSASEMGPYFKEGNPSAWIAVLLYASYCLAPLCHDMPVMPVQCKVVHLQLPQPSFSSQAQAVPHVLLAKFGQPDEHSSWFPGGAREPAWRVGRRLGQAECVRQPAILLMPPRSYSL
jgi:hypothetical protein